MEALKATSVSVCVYVPAFTLPLRPPLDFLNMQGDKRRAWDGVRETACGTVKRTNFSLHTDQWVPIQLESLKPLAPG